MSNKGKLQEGVIQLSKSCTCVIKNDIFIPKKLKYPGTCTIPCDIWRKHIGKALYDLGSGVNLMPLSLATSIGVLEGMKLVQVLSN